MSKSLETSAYSTNRKSAVRRSALLAAAAATLVASGSAQAAWIGTTNNLDYLNTANWASSTIDDTFSGNYPFVGGWGSSPGQTANVTAYLSGTSSFTAGNGSASGLEVGMTVTGANFPGGTTITAVNLVTGVFSTSAASINGASANTVVVAAVNNPYNVIFNNDHAVAGDLTFSYVNPSNISLIADASPRTLSFSAAAPTISVAIGDRINRTVTLGNANLTLDFTNKTPTFAVDLGQPALPNTRVSDILNIVGPVANINGFNKTGAGRVQLSNNLNALTGIANVTGGQVHVTGRLNDAGVNELSEIRLTGQASYLRLNTTQSNPVGTDTVLKLNGGGIFQESVAVPTLKQVDLVAGNNILSAFNNSGVGGFNITTLNRQNDSTLILGYNTAASGKLGGTGREIITIGNESAITSQLVGGGTGPGTTTISILPWAASGGTANTVPVLSDNTNYNWVDLVTYIPGTGFYALTTGAEYVTTIAGSGNVNDNVKITAGESLTGDKTINALVNSGNNVLNLGGFTLTLTSGQFVAGSNSPTISNGTLDTGVNPFIIGGRSNPATISANVTNSVTTGNTGLISTGVATVLLSGINSYGGNTIVAGGVLQAGSATALPATTNVRVDRNAVLQVNTGITSSPASLAGTGTVRFQTAANANQLNLGGVTGANNAVTVNSTGLIAPGDPSGEYQASVLTLGNNVTTLDFNTGSFFKIDLASLSTFDSINLTAGLGNVDGGTLQVSLLDGYSPVLGNSWNIITGTLGATGTGFTGITAINPLSAGLSYSAAPVGNNWVLSVVVPEPTTLTILGLMGTGALVRRRRRA